MANDVYQNISKPKLVKNKCLNSIEPNSTIFKDLGWVRKDFIVKKSEILKSVGCSKISDFKESKLITKLLDKMAVPIMQPKEDVDDQCVLEKAGKIPAFDWPRLPQKRYLTNKHEFFDNNETLYPNCDAEIWTRSCDKEILEPIIGKVKGVIPKWLEGSLLRNGPGSIKVGKYRYDHLFDSFGLLHKFHIENGEVTYQCRFVQSDVYKRNTSAQRIVFTEFGTKAIPDPCRTIFDKVSTVFNSKEQSDNSMISVYPFGDEVYVFAETGIMHKINPVDLSTEKKVNLYESMAIVNHTSHPHVMENGTVYNLGLQVGSTGPVHSIVCFPCKDVDGKKTCFDQASIVASVPAKWPLNPSYMHSFGITENYFIIVEQPLCVSATNLLKCKFKNEPLIGALKWFFDEKTKFSILSRKTGKQVHEFYSEPFFYLHIINQYEIDDYIIVDICGYRDPKMLECMYIDAMKNLHKNPEYPAMFRGRPIRFVLPLKVSNKLRNDKENLVKIPNCNARAYRNKNRIFVEAERLVDLGCETPRINYDKYLGKKYRYFYAISSDVDLENPGTLIKADVKMKTTKIWQEKNCYPSEPVFVPSPNSKSEDDGVLLTVLLRGKNDDNYVGFLVIDAKTMKEIGRVDFRAEGPVPKCLHGWYLPNKNKIN